MQPDLLVFVADPDQPDWKESANRALKQADLVVNRRITDEVLRRVREGLKEPRPPVPDGPAGR
jgi:hypothetical protein